MANTTRVTAEHDTTSSLSEVFQLRTSHNLLVASAENLVSTVNSLRTALITALGNGLLAIGTVQVTTATEKFKTTTTLYYSLSGIQYSKAAADNLTFSAANTINTGAAAGQFWGVWLLQVNAAGTISTKAPAADQVYTTEALAIAALPAADAGNIGFARLTIRSKADTKWTANTDDLVAASDCAAINIVDFTPIVATGSGFPAAASAVTATLIKDHGES